MRESTYNKIKDLSMKDLSEFVGAWENDKGQVVFGSWMALRAFYIYSMAQIANDIHNSEKNK